MLGHEGKGNPIFILKGVVRRGQIVNFILDRGILLGPLGSFLLSVFQDSGDTAFGIADIPLLTTETEDVHLAHGVSTPVV